MLFGVVPSAKNNDFTVRLRHLPSLFIFFWAIYYFCDVYREKDGGKLWLLVWAQFRVEIVWPMAVFVVVQVRITGQTRSCFQSANLMLTPWIWGTCKPYLSALPLFCIATWLCVRSWLSILPFGASGEQLPPAKEADTGQDKRTCAANIQGKLQKPAWWVAGRSSLASICRQDRASFLEDEIPITWDEFEGVEARWSPDGFIFSL